MAALILPRRFNRQPQGWVEVAPSAVDLIAFFVVGDWYYDGKDYGTYKPGSGQSVVASPYGVSIKTTADSLPDAIAYHGFPLSYKEYGFVWVGRGSGGIDGAVETISGSVFTYIGTSGGLRYSQAGLTGHYAPTVSFSDTGNAAYTGAFSVENAEARLYLGGQLLEAGTHSTASATTVASVRVGTYNSAANRSWRGDQELFALLNRPAFEIARELSANPWQMFKVTPRRIYFDLGSGGGAGTTIDPANGSVTATGYAPSVGQSITVAPAKGALTATGYAPSVSQPVTVSPAKGSALANGYTPTLDQPRTIAPSKASIAATGYAPTVDQGAGQTVEPTKGAVSATGYAPSIEQPITVSPVKGSVTATGYLPTVSQDASVTVSPSNGRVTATGYTPTIAQPISVSPSAGHALLTGNQPIVVQSIGVSPSKGRITATGHPPTISQPRTITVTAGQARITGRVPTISQVVESYSAYMIYAVAPKDTTFSVAAKDTTFVVEAKDTTYAVTPKDSTFVV